MRIAQLAPLYESVPPKLYGGTERVVSFLTEELVRRGHEVTLFASGDSRTCAKLVSPCAEALRLNRKSSDGISPHILMLAQVAQHAAEFDLIHSHLETLPFQFLRRSSVPAISTLHGRLDLPEYLPLFKEFGDLRFISISDAQRSPLPGVPWMGTVHHGLPKDLLSFSPEPGHYLAFLGRLSAEKGFNRAVEIARRAGMALRVAAKLDPSDEAYYNSTVRPLLNDPAVEFIGEIGEDQKSDFLGKAAALLFPIDWPEPFGLVMIEAMACGTPVVGFPMGSVPEILEPGVTGFIAPTVEEAVKLVPRALGLPRALIRETFERSFTASRMAEDYVRIYERLVPPSQSKTALEDAAIHPDPGGDLPSIATVS